MTEAVDLTPIELALQAWVVEVTGLPDGRVIWSGYGQRRPQLPAAPGNQWISLVMSSTRDDGWPWIDEIGNPLTFAPFTFTADPSTPPGLLTSVAHGRLTGDGPVQLTTTHVLPAGLALVTDYWAIKLDPDTLRLAASFEDAMSTAPVPVVVSGAGTGVHTLSATPEALRAGEEQLSVVNVYTTATLSVQCYGGSPTGSRSPLNILRTLVTSAQLQSRQETFEEADVFVTPSGRINDVGTLINSSRWEPRAHVDIEVTFTASLSEEGTIIERVGAVLAIADLVEVGGLAIQLADPLGGDVIVETVETVFDVTSDGEV